MKKVIVIFEVPEIILSSFGINANDFTADGVNLYRILTDTDKKHTILDLCIGLSIEQEQRDAEIEKKAKK